MHRIAGIKVRGKETVYHVMFCTALFQFKHYFAAVREKSPKALLG